jgi:hypothetical protein
MKMVGLLAVAVAFTAAMMVIGARTARRENDRSQRFSLPVHSGGPASGDHEYEDPNPI